MRGVLVRDGALASDRLDDRDAALDGERRHGLFGERVAHAAARDEQRLLRRLQKRHGLRDLAAISPLPRNGPRPLLEERLRVVESHLLDVLRQADEGGAAIAGIEHRGDRLRQRRNDLRRMSDAIPVPRHRLEGVVHGDGRVAEMLDLLEHRVRKAVGEGVAGEEQNRQTVRQRRSRRRHHVRRAGSDRRRRDHDLPAALGLGEADGCERHRLLVLSAPGRQAVLHGLKRLRKAGDVAVPEDGEHAGEQRRADAIDLGELLREPPGQGLGHGQTDCRAGHAVSSLCAPSDFMRMVY